MTGHRKITARGLTFDVHEGGPTGGEPVLLLHGFPQDHREFDLIQPRLHEAGLRTFAVDQRGYSPGARPAGVAAYRLSEPVADVVAVMDELGVHSAHVLGHDWGAQVSWLLAAHHPERVRTLTAISVPHPKALRSAVRAEASQRAQLAYQRVFRSPDAERLLLSDDAARLTEMMRPIGSRRELYGKAMREPGRLTACLNWYRAPADPAADIGAITVPATLVWSDEDPVFGPVAARHTADFVEADYRLVTLTGVGHWVPEEAPDALARAALARIHS
ncbi:alpha/beta fold hydrolase [Actinoplanes sp. URMC 104]|uniref:alpha/beta fold hydrolase n=1 Tax=Actinoplanes sp. URMC 104 TaxID=3423409 RepID=UPI003F198FC4